MGTAIPQGAFSFLIILHFSFSQLTIDSAIDIYENKEYYPTLLCFFLFSPSSASAVSISIDDFPSSISDEEFTVQITVSGASAGQEYLRAEIYKDGTTNYFGETKVGDTWCGGTDGKEYFPPLIPDAKTSVTTPLSIRKGSPTSTDYPGPGEYKLQIKRYTPSGNPASDD